MQVSSANNVKVYNLSTGKSLPEWLSDRKKRALQKSDHDVQKRIQLIQDFEMPTVSGCVQVSPDGQYILATGTYKPRLRCYDVNHLSMKFERCMDSEVVKFHVLSEDYSKLVFLQCDRYVEFHAKYGRYHRLRIPKFGRDLAYHKASCDLFLVGVSPEIYRINLEQGRFLSPFVADSVAINTCSVNPVHQLLAAGTIEGRVECWDPRTRRKAGVLDCALSSITSQTQVKGVPAVTSLAFNGAMRMAVGTSTGQILLYDIRSNKPTLVKDHRNGLAIRSLEFSPATEMVASSDSRAVKIWDQSDGKPYVTVEAEHDFNDVCLVPNSGLMLMACEAPKLLSYFIPGLGQAPKWCSFLDSLTEELEENPASTVYDDYKFVTKTELESLGLSHLIGTSLLRAYMHGYFIDIRLYHKAKSIADPFAYQEYRKNKIKEKIEEQRTSRVKVKKLPSVNAALAEKLQEEQLSEKAKKAKKEGAANILSDDRFSALFKNPDFQVDEQSEEFRLVQPLVNKQSKKREKPAIVEQFEELDPQDEEMEGHASSDGDSSSDEDDRSWQEELRRQHFALRQEKKMKREAAARDSQTSGPKFYELKSGQEFSMASKKTDGAMKRLKKASLAERVAKEADFLRKTSSSLGNQQISFKSVKNEKNRKRREEAAEHHKERRKLRRSAGNLSKKKHHRSATS
ncbi:nucleolar protein 10-like [Lytechinus variegatus]|uniref:nucleolar protein 10-like n=1 Tax=Lytechinus variegatus TaxID=7654 RepID=UPI001BB187CD|nr:nucleolar protein 10-like [Lytechinus variegatus]